MIVKSVSYKELVTGVGYNNKSIGIEVQLEPGETLDEIFKCAKAYVELRVKSTRITEAQDVIDAGVLPNDCASYKEAERILIDNAELIERSERIAKRVVPI